MDARLAIRSQLLRNRRPGASALVVEELGIEHGAVRVDIAVVTDILHGYEIKSASDRLSRLPAQVAAYSRCMDRATLLTSEHHLAAATAMLPEWWGIKVLTAGKRGGIAIRTLKRASKNPAVSAFHLAHLLWRPECILALTEKSCTGGASRMTRLQMYERIVALYSLDDLRRFVRRALVARSGWRSPEPKL